MASLRHAVGHHASLLLLAPFVGFGTGDSQAQERAEARVESAFRELGIEESEIQDLTVATIRTSTEDDYLWIADPQLGWVFGGEYPCYSLRNRAHLNGNEGVFPFVEYRQMLEDLPEPV